MGHFVLGINNAFGQYPLRHRGHRPDGLQGECDLVGDGAPPRRRDPGTGAHHGHRLAHRGSAIRGSGGACAGAALRELVRQPAFAVADLVAAIGYAVMNFLMIASASSR
jgi:hypothetical protein